jgi:phospholipase D1/2
VTRDPGTLFARFAAPVRKSTTARPKARPRRGPAWGKIAAIALVLAALAAAWRYTPIADYLTLGRINGWARAIRDTPWAPIAVILAYTPASFLMFPRPLITITSVIAFGTWVGLSYGFVGVVIAALVSYFLGRVLPEKTMKRLAGDHIEPVGKVLRHNAFTSILALSFLPAPPFVVQGAIAGALRLNVWKYTLATFLGNAPGMVVTTIFGRQIASALDQSGDVSYWILGGVVVFFVVMTVVVRRWFARQLASEERAERRTAAVKRKTARAA